MLVSRNWLSDYVNIDDIDNNEINTRMPLIGNEIEEITPMCDASNLVIGKVLKCVMHPESDHLHICDVLVGDKTLQIVCGAPNVCAGIYVIVACSGAVLPGGIKIKNTTLRGIESNGMICSLGEIGIQDKYIPDEFKNGIYIIKDVTDNEIGSNALDVLKLNDSIINFELTANRSDLYSIIGCAYEFAAVYNREVVLPDTKYNVVDDSVENYINLNVQTMNCPLYSTKMVRDIKIGESPRFIKSRLIASGIRPINNVVDISNYVMLEYGQPLHFFDSDKLGNNIVVRMAKNGEKLVTLDGVERILDNEDIVIANDKEIVALAGVMGGYSTEVDNNTKNITIEAAIFNPANIRNTSKNVLRSEASIRFEKGVDALRTKQALDRACHLLEVYADAKILDSYVVSSSIDKAPKNISITTQKICEVLGMNIKTEEIANIFERLGFSYVVNGEEFVVTIPSRRLDISIKEDLIEEVGRLHGYSNMKGITPYLKVKKGGVSPFEKYKTDIRNYLSSLGLNEVITYTLTNTKKSKMFTNDNFSNIQVIDPLSEDKKVTRYSLIPSLIEVSEYNKSRNINDVSIFEISNIYYKYEGNVVEKNVCACLLTGNYINDELSNNTIKVDFYLLKGIVESLFNYLKLDGRYEFLPENIPSEMHPYRSASIYVDKKYVGLIGEVLPSIRKNEYVFELNLDELFELKIRNIKYKEISKYPTITKDMAFIVDDNIKSIDMVNFIKKNGTNILSEVDIFDVYVGEHVGAGKKSIAFKLLFKDNNKTLTDDEVMTVFNKIINSVEQNFSATLRNK